MRPLDDFFETVEALVQELDIRADEECWYRGHASSRYTLLPSLLRPGADGKVRTANEISSNESDLYWEFRARAISLNVNATSGWDMLFHMRHHGVATRLLDWTDNLGNALYFALRGHDPAADDGPCIWLLNGYALNEISASIKEPESPKEWFRELFAPQYVFDQSKVVFDAYSDAVAAGEGAGIYWEMPIAIYPEHKNYRLHAQRGYFTIHGKDSRPIEEQVPPLVREIKIPPELVGPALKFFERAGINEYSLFPDLDGLARHLNGMYGY
jgi:hypothetical protein